MAGSSFFTVTFLSAQTGLVEVSRYFDTKRAAMNWAKWLTTRNFVSKAWVYNGPAGGNLLTEVAR